MNKKADVEWDQVIKWALVILLLIALFMAIAVITGSMNRMWDALANLFRFGR